jgi:predicted MPP superfamily phosphohydrolase
MSFFLRSALLVGLLLFIDWYFFQAVATLTRNFTGTKKTLVTWLYWGFTAFSLLVTLTPLVIPFQQWPKFARVYLVSLVLIVCISKLVGVVFVLLDDIVRGGRIGWAWLAERLSSRPLHGGEPISRMDFLNQLALVAASVPFVSFLYGMARGAFNYTVHHVAVPLANLPDAFNGLKILHISDIHIGSFTSAEPLERAVEIISAQKPDVVFFTGDLVNNEATETNGFLPTLRKIQAPMGVFSSIGNHDYGDYVSWPSPEEKRSNFEQLKRVHAEAGWTLLMNEHRVLERDGPQGTEKIAVLGIENWGAAMNFPKRGDLRKAVTGTDGLPVKLLLSHDPSHWDAQVTKEFPDVDVMFSGHTHGAQFGVEIPGFRWSPVQYFYKQWAGLYKRNDNASGRVQYLYVNRGLGFLGYPGRVGISPEITVMTLQKMEQKAEQKA